MNGKELLEGMNYVNSKYIEEAETAAFQASESHRTLKRPLLIAALIALMLMLVGCAVVYVLRMQDVKIGEATATRDYRLVDGTYVEDPHEVSENILTLAGLKGTNAYQACADFFAFKEEYTRNMEAMMTAGTLPEGFLENDTYGKAMTAKAEELARQYGLKLEGEYLDFRTTRNLCDALGIQRFTQDSEEISASIRGGSCYENGNFYLYFGFDFPEDRGYEVLSTSGYLRWNRTDCFSRDYVALVDSGDWIERNYTTASGSEVLILQSPSQERGYILCDRGDALMSLQLDVNIELLSEENGIVSAEYQHMTDRQIELVADAVDFTVQPRVPTREDVANQAGISQSATQNGWTVTLKSVETDGYVAQVRLGVTAPEDAKLPEEGNIIFGNRTGDFTPASGSFSGYGGTIDHLEDGDGLSNTFDLLMEYDHTSEDGSAPYAAGTTWNLHIVDIMESWWDDANARLVENTLVEGEWLFPITFGESNADYREVELLSEPVRAKACYGWGEDGTDALEEFTLTSFKLRKFSCGLQWDRIPNYHGTENFGDSADFFGFADQTGYHRALIVMKDGTEISLPFHHQTINLDQVSHVILADGTLLPMPGTEPLISEEAAVPATETGGVELLSQPMDYNSLAGYVEGADGVREDLYETFHLTSIRLSPSGLTIQGTWAFNGPDVEMQVVMLDGTQVTLTGSGEPLTEAMSVLSAATLIDLHNADYVLLPDGTRLDVPK